jgi:uncharacterized LabA/DUF88 family protein
LGTNLASVPNGNTTTAGPLRARVYVDGFNFYYGAVKGTVGRKWLDFRRFGERIIPAGAVFDELHYFTTRIAARPNDPDAPTRQDAFLRAIATLEGVFVHEGSFKATKKRRQLVDPQPMGRTRKGKPTAPYRSLEDLGWPRNAWTYNTEEKQSDVNLAVKLVADCLDDLFDVAVVISDDTDLSAPIVLARDRGKRVVVLSPRGYVLDDLASDERDRRTIHRGVLEACQMPDPLALADGTAIHKPESW